MPSKRKDCYLAYLLTECAGKSALIFASKCAYAQRVTLMLRNLGFGAICLHGQMSQSKRLGSLNKFKASQRDILVATDVASRGLDIPSVDVVVNYDIPTHGKVRSPGSQYAHQCYGLTTCSCMRTAVTSTTRS